MSFLSLFCGIMLSVSPQILLPAPAEYTESTEIYVLPLSPTYKIETDAVIDDISIAYFKESLANSMLTAIPLNTKGKPEIKIEIGKKKFLEQIKKYDWADFAKEEAYFLTVDEKGILIQAVTIKGAFNALQSLLQLTAVSNELNYCKVVDYPRFKYRGLMLDISRHFRDKSFIIKQLDAMRRLKMNVLHLHLTDDAGWRIQIDKYPRLQEFAAWREGKTWREWYKDKKYAEQGSQYAHGGYLTKKDVKEIVEYASKNHITVIPEIEMPGHSGELTKAYPEISCISAPDYRDSCKTVFSTDLCPGNEKTYEMLEGILSEIIDIFPSKYIHIGGDEAGKTSWHNCPRCKQKMEEEHLANADELQSYLIKRIERFIISKGRSMIGWDEILEGGLAPNATVMSWRGTEGGIKAMQMGHDVIMSPTTYCYIDYTQDAPFKEKERIGGYLPLTKTYSYNPSEAIPADSLAHHLLGVQANLWTEFIETPEYAEYMMYPRTMAIAEIGWTKQDKRDFSDFKRRAIKMCEKFNADGYMTFDLTKEFGSRPESLKPLSHLGIGKAVKYDIAYNPKYHAGGDSALADGKFGDWGFSGSDNAWQGFDSDIDVTFDLGSVQDLHYVGATFFSNLWVWIAQPEKTEIYLSKDGENFTLADTQFNMIPEESQYFIYMKYGTILNTKARYVRFKAYRTIAPRHEWLFVDEIVIN